MNECNQNILNLKLEIENHEYWLNDGRMSNPKKIKYRKRALKRAQRELKELKQLS